MALKKLLATARSLLRGHAGASIEYPLETERRLNELHGRAPIDRHLEILYRDVFVGGDQYVDLYRRCLKHTGTVVTPFNVFHRFQSRLNLLRYFIATLPLPGARTECGVYRGATALLVCNAWRSSVPGFKGGDFYLIDSFAGTSASTAHDLIPVRNAAGAVQLEPFFPAGKTDTTPELVRGYFSDFPQVTICSGWIPSVFATLPERDWAFVHLDVTLYEPTLAALEYFYPRLNQGGVIICDGSIFCPGANKAVDAYCGKRDIPFIVFDDRDFVIIKQ